MTFRLPRLPETAEIVEANRRPSFKFQRWWQSIVAKLESQEAIQDQALIDIQTALTNAGIALDRANSIMPDLPPETILADHTGAVLSGQLPRSVQAQRFEADTDVTASSAWSATTLSGSATYTIGAATGLLEITAIAANTVIQVTSVRDSITRSRKLTVTRALSDPPQSSGAGAETAYDSSIDPTASASYGTANAGPISLACGASGDVELSAPLTMVSGAADGVAYSAFGQWQYRAVGDPTWLDVDTETAGGSAATSTGGLVSPGAISVNETVSGLTPTTDYEFQLLLRNSSGTETMYYYGSASATTS